MVVCQLSEEYERPIKMKCIYLNAFVFVLLVTVLVPLVGCQEEALMEPRKANLVADENHRLKRQLEQCVEERDKQIKLLDECKQQQGKLTSFLMDTVRNEFKEENVKLKTENELLKAQVEQLQMEIKELKEQPVGTGPFEEQQGL